MKEEILKINNCSKTYKTKTKNIEVLKNINAKFNKNKFYLIIGHSGSGKTTLINILGLLDKFDGGKYTLYGNDILNLNDTQISDLRMNKIGFIFQNFCLNPNLTALENVMVPMLINKKIISKNRKDKAMELLKSVKLENRITHFPKELSGGEQQRVSIARALANDPNIILADEPTGNLDEENEKIILSMLKELSQKGKCVIVVSHSLEAKKYADKIYKLNNGNLIGD